MDIMLHEENTSGYFESEDEIFRLANEVLQKLITDVEDLLRDSESKSSFSSDQSDLSVKIDQISSDNLEILMKTSECKTGLSYGQPDLKVNEGKTICEESQVDVLRSAGCNVDTNSGQSDLGVCHGQINQEDRQNLDSSNEDFEDFFVGLNSDKDNLEEIADNTSDDDIDFLFDTNVARVPMDAPSEDEDADLAIQPHEEIEDRDDLEEFDQDFNFINRVFPNIHAMGDNITRVFLIDLGLDEADDNSD